MRSIYRLMVRNAEVSGPVQQFTHDGEQCLEVRDLSSRITTRVRVRDISPYRHTVFLDGREFRVLNVLRAA